MSAIALKWLGRQKIADRSLMTILRGLAETANKAGSVSIGQVELARRVLLTDRTIRSGLNLLEHFGTIHRQAQSARKAGRIADLITLVMDRDFSLSESEVIEARRSGCTHGNYRKDGAGCTTTDNRKSVPVEGSAPNFEEVDGLYIARVHALNLNAADVETLKEASARVWKERDVWRARLTYQGLNLDLGRHECRDLAQAECRVALLDIAHSLRTKSGTPREPKIDPALESLHGRALCDFLFGSDEEMGRPTGRAAERDRVRDPSPDQGYGLDPTAGSLQSITDTMAATGGGAEKLNGIVIALGQAWTKQKFQGEEAMQLMERGVPVWDLLSKATGKSAMELMSLSEKGKLGRKEIQLLIDQMGKRFAGASEEYAKTFTGILSNLQDNWTKFLKRIADSGAFQKLKDRMQDLLDTLGRLDQSGKLDGVAKRISRGFEWAIDQVVFDIKNLGKVLSSVDLSGKMKPFLTALGLLVARVFPVATVFAAAALAFEDWLAYMAGADSVIGDFVDSMAKFFGTNPEQMATILGNIATAAGWLAAGALGITLFASALRSLSGALLLISAAKGAVGILGRLAGISWGAAAAGASTAAGTAAGTAATFNPAAAVASGGIALSAGAATVTGSMTPEGYEPGNGASFELSSMEAHLAGGESLTDPIQNFDPENAHMRFDPEGKFGIKGSASGKVSIEGSEGNAYAILAEFMELIASDQLQINYGSSAGTGHQLQNRAKLMELAAKMKAMAL